MISATTEIENLFKSGNTIGSTHKVICEWNQNAYNQVDYIGSYPITILASSSDQTYAKTFNTSQETGGWDNGGSFDNVAATGATPITIENKERKRFVSIQDIIKPERPDPGIVFAVPFPMQNSTQNISSINGFQGPILSTNSYSGQTSLKSNNILLNQNRIYPAAEGSKTKYWTSARKRQYNATRSLSNSFIGVSNANGVMEGNNAFVVYNQPVKTNKIVIKTQIANGYPVQFAVEALKDISGTLTWVKIFGVSTDSTEFSDGILRLTAKTISGSVVWTVATGVETENTLTDLNTSNTTDYETIRGLRFSAQKMNRGNAILDIIEISPRLVFDLTGYVSGIAVDSNIGDDILGMPAGSIVPSNGSVQFFNNDYLLSNKNDQSKLYQLLKPNVKFTILNVIGTSYIPIKVMYSTGWTEASDWTVNVSLEDYMKFFNELSVPDILIGAADGIKISSILKIILDNIGFTRYSFEKTLDANYYEDKKLDFFYCSKEQSVAQVLNDLSTSLQLSIFFNESNYLVVKTKEAVAQKNKNINYWFVGDHKSVVSGDPEYSQIYDTSTSSYKYISNIESFDDEIVAPATSGEIQYQRLGLPKVSTFLLEKSIQNNQDIYTTTSEDYKKILDSGYAQITLNRNLSYFPQEVWSLKEGEDAYLSCGILKTDMKNTRPSSYLPNASSPTKISASNKNDAIRAAFNSLTVTQRKGAEIQLYENNLAASFSKKYTGYVIIDSEIIKYNGVRYNITRPGAAFESKIYFSEEERQADIAVSPSGSSFMPVSLIVDIDMQVYSLPTLSNGSMQEYTWYCKGDGRAAEDTKIQEHFSGITGTTNNWTNFSTSLYKASNAQSSTLKPTFRLLVDTGINKSTNSNSNIFVGSGYAKLIGPTSTVSSNAVPSYVQTNEISMQKNGQQYITGVKKDCGYVPKILGTRLSLLAFKNQTTETGSKIAGLGFYLSSTNSGTTGYFLEFVSMGESSVDGSKFNNIYLYKVYNSSGTIVPKTLYATYSNIIASEIDYIPTSDTLASSENSSTSTIAVDVSIIDSVITVYFQGIKLFSVTDSTNPIPATNYVGMFVRDDSNAIYDYFYATPNSTPSYIKDSPTFTVDQYSDISTLIKRRLFSPYGKQIIGSDYFYEDFGNLVREARKFDIRFNFPAFSTELISLAQVNPDYYINKFNSTSFGANFWVYNTSGTDVILGQGSSFPMMISGVVLSIMSEDKVDIGDYLPQSDSDIKLNDIIEQNKKMYGESSININGKYITSRRLAQDLAEWIGKNMTKEKIKISMSIFPNPLLELGDTVKVFYKQRGYCANEIGDKSFVISSINYSVSESGTDMNIGLREMV